MATNDKFANEMMSDDELDGVSGGHIYQMRDDSYFLNSLNGSCNRYGATMIWTSEHNESVRIRTEIKDAWAAVGIDAIEKAGCLHSNKYYLNGQEISQQQAREHAMNVVGKQMIESDWNW